jgi:hypothetical protein
LTKPLPTPSPQSTKSTPLWTWRPSLVSVNVPPPPRARAPWSPARLRPPVRCFRSLPQWLPASSQRGERVFDQESILRGLLALSRRVLKDWSPASKIVALPPRRVLVAIISLPLKKNEEVPYGDVHQWISPYHHHMKALLLSFSIVKK